ncbi:MAG: glycosyltransferase family 2 protein, partial [bacterium]|nr:glycosyltransferase family 2 protein [bacterium]
MVIRKTAAEVYARETTGDPDRRSLDRRGASLASAGDIDMVYTVLTQGMAVGYFPELVLDHLIPAARLTYGYMRRMVYQANYSAYRLFLARGLAGRPRSLALALPAGVALCVLQGD